MASVNKAILIGHLGQDPDVKQGATGAFGNMSVATDESYTDKNGQKVQRTEWHRVAVYGKTAENCQRYLRKGSLVYVEGAIATRKWTDPQGVDRWTTEIKAQRVQFLDRKDSGQGNARPPEPPVAAYGGEPTEYGVGGEPVGGFPF